MTNIRVNIDKYNYEWYSNHCQLAQKINESVPLACGRQTAGETAPSESPSHYHRFSLSIPLIDFILSKLKIDSKETRCVFLKICV